MATQAIERPAQRSSVDLDAQFPGRRRLRRQQSVADGAALAITVE
jgi:hypothetical protein